MKERRISDFLQADFQSTQNVTDYLKKKHKMLWKVLAFSTKWC